MNQRLDCLAKVVPGLIGVGRQAEGGIGPEQLHGTRGVVALGGSDLHPVLGKHSLSFSHLLRMTDDRSRRSQRHDARCRSRIIDASPARHGAKLTAEPTGPLGDRLVNRPHADRFEVRQRNAEAQLQPNRRLALFQHTEGRRARNRPGSQLCLLYTSDAADERSSVDLGGRRIINKKNKKKKKNTVETAS